MSGKHPARDCPAMPQHAQHLTEAAILILLGRGNRYGYAMLDQLKSLRLGQGEPDSSTLYRTLRRLERNGFVRSDWAAGGPGPRRRVYEATDAGRAHLHDWIALLKERRRCINTIIAAHDELADKET